MKKRIVKKKLKKAFKSSLNKKIKLPKQTNKKSINKKITKPVIVEIKKPKSRKKSSDRMYFTQDTEDAVVLYNKLECQQQRNQLFETKIKYPFEKLVENVFNTFKFSYFKTGPLDVQKEVVSHLVANMHKYDKEKGKAFAYFSIIAKHYLIYLNNSNYKEFNQSVEIGEDREEHTVQLQSEDKYYKQSEMSEFIKLMVEYWEQNIGKLFSKQRDLNIANAVIELFRNSDRIETFNKKALYLYIRDISNCKTQQITKIINKMKTCYNNIAKSYLNTGMVLNTSK